MKLFTAEHGITTEKVINLALQPEVSPSKELNEDLWNGRITEVEYTARYLEFLRQSMEQNPDFWIKLVRSRRVVLVSFGRNTRVSARVILARLMEHVFKVKYLGDMTKRTIMPPSKFMNQAISEAMEIAIMSFQPPIAPQKSYENMVVDPLAASTVQASTCRQCKENRTAMARTRDAQLLVMELTPKGEDKHALATVDTACCTTSESGVYACPIFVDLIKAYRAGVTSQGTNLNPCKNCVSYIDNGGNCFGDRCPDGPFDIKEGCGIARC